MDNHPLRPYSEQNHQTISIMCKSTRNPSAATSPLRHRNSSVVELFCPKTGNPVCLPRVQEGRCVPCWFIVGSCLAHVWFIVGSAPFVGSFLVRHPMCWFIVGSAPLMFGSCLVQPSVCRSCVVHVWLSFGSTSLFVHCWFMFGSYLVRVWLMFGSTMLLVNVWFIVGSFLVRPPFWLQNFCAAGQRLDSPPMFGSFLVLPTRFGSWLVLPDRCRAEFS